MSKPLIIFTDSGDTIIDESTQVYDERGIVLRAQCIPGADKVLRQLHEEGFTIALVIVGALRELLGAGSIFGIALPGNFEPIAFFVRAPGAFLVLAIVVAIMNAIGIKSRANKVVEGCDGCCASCASSGCDKKEANV